MSAVPSYGRKDIFIAFLFGVIVALVTFMLAGPRSAFDPAYAGTSGGGGGLFGVTGLAVGGNKDFLWVIDQEGQRIAIYDSQASVIQLKSVRNIRYDLKLDEFPPKRQKPSVLDIFRDVEKPPK